MSSLTSTPRPAIVVVHGAWHTPWHYSNLVVELEQRGFEVFCPRLPSQSDTLPLPRNGTYEDDVATIRSVLTTLIDQGYTITVLAHSYGGLVANAAISNSPSLEESSHRSDSTRGRIAHVVYMSAFVIAVGTAITTPLEGKLPPFLDEQIEHGTCTMRDRDSAFYNDVESSNLINECLTRNTHCPASVCRAVMPGAPYEAMRAGHLDATYLVCERDINIPVAFAETMAELLGERKRMKRLDAGHCPMVSQPSAVADAVVEAWIASTQRLESRSELHSVHEQTSTLAPNPADGAVQS